MNRNEELIAAINDWQQDATIHPLTCGNDSRHALLYPVEENGRVVLRCRNCDYRQEWIPGVVAARYAQHKGH